MDGCIGGGGGVEMFWVLVVADHPVWKFLAANPLLMPAVIILVVYGMGYLGRD